MFGDHDIHKSGFQFKAGSGVPGKIGPLTDWRVQEEHGD